MPENEHVADPPGGVPAMTVGWAAPPSFNGGAELPQGDGTGGEAEVAASGPFRFDAPVVRETENVLLAQSRLAVADYETLRARSEAAVHSDSFWIPKMPEQPVAAYSWNVTPGASNGAPSMEEQHDLDQRLLNEFGGEFAATINPAMRQALAMVSNALMLLGNYTSLVNASGQLYSRIDRSVRFPEPPAT
ncbi:hypothetical protein AB0G32_28095 [Streptomyces sp. NPDC023723]|uniref:hypothetical protein n=1 Tax=Streptomyces sp. NPDC023723 TaxID=3154323 RepID=UPI0033C417E7